MTNASNGRSVDSATRSRSGMPMEVTFMPAILRNSRSCRSRAPTSAMFDDIFLTDQHDGLQKRRVTSNGSNRAHVLRGKRYDPADNVFARVITGAWDLERYF